MKYFYIIVFFLFSFANILAQEKAMNYGDNTEIDNLYDEKAFDKIIDLLSKKDDNHMSMRELYVLTKSFAGVKDFGNGLAYANKLIDICAKNKDTTNLVVAYNLKVENLLDLKRINEAYNFCEKITPVFRAQDSVAYQDLCFKQGVSYALKGEYQKAYDTYNKITIKKKRASSLFTNNYGVILEYLHKYDEALDFYKKSLENRKKRRVKDIGIEYCNIGNILMKMGYKDQVKIYLDSALNSFTKETKLRTKKFVYEKHYEYNKVLGNISKARIYLDSMNKINEKIFNKRLNTKLQALKTSYEREALLTKNLEKSKKEKLIGSIFLLIVILALLSFLYYYKYKNIKVAHKIAFTEQKLLRSQMTPHFIFNSLSVLQGMILNKEDKTAVNYLSKFSKLLRIILENSRNKLVSLQDELLAIRNFLDLHNMRSSGQLKYKITVADNINTEEIMIPPMLIQPFIENAIEHGFEKDFNNAEITIDITLSDNKLICVIKDNGIGLNASKAKSKRNKKSLSTKITKERLIIFAKEYNVETGIVINDRSEFNEQGTYIKLILPYKKNDYA